MNEPTNYSQGNKIAWRKRRMEFLSRISYFWRDTVWNIFPFSLFNLHLTYERNFSILHLFFFDQNFYRIIFLMFEFKEKMFPRKFRNPQNNI